VPENGLCAFSPVDPDLLYAAREILEKFVESLLVEILGGDAGDKQSPGLCGFGVHGVDEMLLARQKKVFHLDLDIVEHPA